MSDETITAEEAAKLLAAAGGNPLAYTTGDVAVMDAAPRALRTVVALEADRDRLAAEVERLRAAMRDALDELDGMSMDSAMKDLREALGADHG